jgi:hypothetical protein
MTIWFRKTSGLDSDIMRKAASNINVSWDYQEIIYKKDGVGYANADSGDVSEIQNELESLLGYLPVEIDEPTIDTDTDQPQ